MAIEVEHLEFSYENEPVLTDVSFKIENGDYVGIVGPNGGGKSTLIKLILGILKPDSGSIKINGTSDLKKYTPIIGYVPQHSAESSRFFPASVQEIVESGYVGKDYSPTDRKQKVQDAMAKTGIVDFKKRLIGELSGGQKQRVLIARSLVSNPQILIMDEPTIGIDSQEKERFTTFLKKLNEENRITILIISHDLDVISEEAKSVISIDHKLICHTKASEFMQSDYFAKTYGPKVKVLMHHHHQH